MLNFIERKKWIGYFQLVVLLIDPTNAEEDDPDHERFVMFETIVGRFYELAVTFNG